MIGGSPERAVGLHPAGAAEPRAIPIPARSAPLFERLGPALEAGAADMASADRPDRAPRAALAPVFMSMAAAATELPQRA